MMPRSHLQVTSRRINSLSSYIPNSHNQGLLELVSMRWRGALSRSHVPATTIPGAA